jgi:hypothetical protein
MLTYRCKESRQVHGHNMRNTQITKENSQEIVVYGCSLRWLVGEEELRLLIRNKFL